ncbi:deoxyribodipyrimidine photo-lyase, partial [Klebsiella pneumoniae]
MVSAQRGGEDEAGKQWQHFEENIGFYPIMKDFPARKGTSRLSAYLSVGCISPRVLAAEAAGQGADAWLDNLIQR